MDAEARFDVQRFDLQPWHGPPDAARYAALKTHPRFGEWVKSFACAMLAAGDADPLLDGILKDAGRNAVAMFAAHLHFSGGITLPRLKDLCARLGLISLGRARALLMYLRYLGYVVPAGAQSGRSPALYQATDQFLHTWWQMEAEIWKSLTVIAPDNAALRESPILRDRLSRFSCYQSEGFLASAPHIDRNAPYFRVFMHAHAGNQIVHSLLAASEEGFPPQAPIAFSAAATAARFRVSRVHVRRVLAAGERAGLLRLYEDGKVAFTAEGQAALEFIFATQLLQFLRAAAQTLESESFGLSGREMLFSL